MFFTSGAFHRQESELCCVADSTLPAAERRNYKGVGDAFVRIVAEDGVGGLFRGAGPTIVRAMALNMGMFASNEQAKEMLTQNTSLTGLPMCALIYSQSVLVRLKLCEHARQFPSRRHRESKPRLYGQSSSCIRARIIHSGATFNILSFDVSRPGIISPVQRCTKGSCRMLHTYTGLRTLATASVTLCQHTYLDATESFE